MNEEIIARFGADTTGFERGRQTMIAGNQEIGRSFIHPSNGAREFHKLLHGITEQSPILGTALKAAISPISGAIAGATLAFGFFKKQIDDWEKRTDALEKGTDKPINNIKDALRDAQKALADFDRDWEKFQRGQNKTASEKLVENLHEQLGLLEKQTSFAEKLSAKDKERLEHQKLLVEQGLKSRALFALNAQKESARGEMTAANAAERAILGHTTISTAEGLIKADEEFAAKKRVELEGFGRHVEVQPGMPREYAEALAAKNAKRALVEEEIRAAERRIERNENKILQEQEARKDAAGLTAAARAKFSGANAAFDTMSISLDQTNQSLRTNALGFSSNAPISSTDAWLAKSAANLHAWNLAHGIKDNFAGASAKALQDPTSKNIEDMNAMFRQIITEAGMKVTMTIEDQ